MNANVSNDLVLSQRALALLVVAFMVLFVLSLAVVISSFLSVSDAPLGYDPDTIRFAVQQPK